MPDRATYDDAELVENIRYHGVAGRMLARLRERPSLVTQWLLDALRDVHAEARRDWDRKLRLLHELRSASLVPDDTVLLKGPTTYALTGDRALLRASADIDLLPRAPDAVADRLRRDGFDTGAPNAPYEAAELHLDGTSVELHRYYPAFAFPHGLDASDTAPRVHPGRWRFRGGFELRRVDHRDVVATATSGIAVGTHDVLVANATMATLVLCCHVFNSYHFGARPPRVRLAELADVVMLRRDARFSPNLFAQLVRDHGGRDAVALVDELAVRTLGTAPFSRRSAHDGRDARARRAPLPQDLWWSYGSANFVVATGAAVSVDDLLLRRVDAGRLVRYLGATPLVAGDGAPARPPRRMLVHAQRAHPLQPCVAATASDAGLGLSLRVDLPRAVPLRRVRVLCNLGHRVIEVTPSRHGADAAPAGAPDGRVRCVAHGATIALELPWDAVGGPPRARRGIPMLLGVRVAREAAFEPDASTLVPLVLRTPR